LAKTPRSWTGARTPSGLKRVRQAERRHDVLQPRRSAAKTLVAKAIKVATQPIAGDDPQLALAEAISALDKAAKVGAIHRNAAARRKSRLARKISSALGGAHVLTGGRITKTTGKAAAAKAAKARIAAGKAGKAKGAQTAAGKARAALSRTARTEAAAAAASAASAASAKAAPTKPAPKTRAAATKASGAKAGASKSAASKSTRTATAKASADKPATRSKKVAGS
jgi:ribosomal protein S20